MKRRKKNKSKHQLKTINKPPVIFPIDDYEFFHPQWAMPEEVWVWDNWWQIPPDAVEHTINFGKFLERSTLNI